MIFPVRCRPARRSVLLNRESFRQVELDRIRAARLILDSLGCFTRSRLMLDTSARASSLP